MILCDTGMPIKKKKVWSFTSKLLYIYILIIRNKFYKNNQNISTNKSLKYTSSMSSTRSRDCKRIILEYINVQSMCSNLRHNIS